MSVSRRVLVVSFFYPPDTAVGGRRVAKFAEYLPEFDWRPTVLTAAGTAEAGAASNVVATPWWSPWAEIPGIDESRAGKAGAPAGEMTPEGDSIGAGQSVRGSLSERAEAAGGLARAAYRAARHLLPLSTVRMPDATLGWVPHAVARGSELLEANDFDAVLSSFGPPSSHIVAARLQARSGIPWVADFRDLWSDNHWDYRIPPFRWAERALERRLLRRASALTSVAPGWTARLEALHDKPAHVVYNGFDPTDYPDAPPGPTTPDGAGELVITYVGTLYWPGQDPSPFFSALARLEDTRAADLDACRFRVHFLGTGPAVVDRLAREFGLSHRVLVSPRVPHRQCLIRQRRSAGLLYVGWSTPDEGFLTAKLFEYLGAHRPILAVGPGGGAVSDLLQECGHAGLTADPAEIARRLGGWLDELLRARRISVETNKDAIEKYTRRRQTERMAEVLDSATRKRRE